MKKNFEPLEVETESLHPEGYGVAHSSLGKLAIPGSLAGEILQVQPLRRKKKLRFAQLISIINPSPDRVEPFCSAAGRCGGCSYQHFDPGRQLAFKESQLAGLLGDYSESMMAPVTGRLKHYRVKARLGVKFVTKKNRVLVGFREKLGGYIADIDSCEVLAKPVHGYIGKFESLIEKLSDPSSIPQLEIAVGDTSAAVVIRHLKPLHSTDLAALESFAKHNALQIYLQPGNEASAWKLYPANDNQRLYYYLKEWQLTYGFHPLDFIQVNRDINEKLVSRVVALLEVQPQDRIIDFFCGIGNFTLPLALTCAEVYGLEGSEAAVRRAEENARCNNLLNTGFCKADLFEPTAATGLELSNNNKKYNKVLLDPPRSGALAVVKKLVNSGVERVVYVSCNPATLARDARILCDEGNYRLTKAGVIDMFPHTTHVESIACFTR